MNQKDKVHGNKGKVAWNKGLTKETSESVRKNAENGSKTAKAQYAEGVRVVWNKGLHVRTNTGKTHFKKGRTPWNKDRPMDEKYRQNVIIGTRKAGADPNDVRHSEAWRKQASEADKKKIANGCKVGFKRCKYTLKTGETLSLRSITESKFVKVLEDKNIDFQYESLSIRYIGKDGLWHSWLADFYLPAYNLIVDTKHGDYYKDYELLNKVDATKKLGYKVLVIDYELYKGNPEPSLIMKLIEEGVETIPKGSRIWNYLSESEMPGPLLVSKGEEIVHAL
jgi:hypothetical protein